MLAVFVASVFSGVTPALLAEAWSARDGHGRDDHGGPPAAGTSAAEAEAALDAAASAGAAAGSRAPPGPARRRAADSRLVACADLRRLRPRRHPRCPTGGTAGSPTWARLRASNRPPYSAGDGRLPADMLVVTTDGSPATTDRIRTASTRPAPFRGSAPRPKPKGDRRLVQLNRLANLALALTLTIAGCSLTVAVAAGIIERKRPSPCSA